MALLIIFRTCWAIEVVEIHWWQRCSQSQAIAGFSDFSHFRHRKLLSPLLAIVAAHRSGMTAPGKQDATNRAPNAQLIQLQKPEKLSEVLKQDKYDCLSCRLTGQW